MQCCCSCGHLPLTRVSGGRKQIEVVTHSLLSQYFCYQHSKQYDVNDTWCCGPQNCRSEEGHVRLEGRWQRKQPAAVFSILLHFSSVSLVSMFFNSDSVASSVKTSPLVFFSNFPFVVTMFSCNALQKTFLSLTSKSYLRVLRGGISEKADLLLFPFLLFRAMHPCRL